MGPITPSQNMGSRWRYCHITILISFIIFPSIEQRNYVIWKQLTKLWLLLVVGYNGAISHIIGRKGLVVECLLTTTNYSFGGFNVEILSHSLCGCWLHNALPRDYSLQLTIEIKDYRPVNVHSFVRTLGPTVEKASLMC